MSEDYSCRPIELWAISAKCGIAQDDQVLGDYATKEAAFEAVLGPASNAIKLGQPVTISVEGSEPREPALGTR